MKFQWILLLLSIFIRCFKFPNVFAYKLYMSQNNKNINFQHIPWRDSDTSKEGSGNEIDKLSICHVPTWWVKFFISSFNSLVLIFPRRHFFFLVIRKVFLFSFQEKKIALVVWYKSSHACNLGSISKTRNKNKYYFNFSTKILEKVSSLHS